MERLTHEKLGNSYGLKNPAANEVGAFKDYNTFYAYLIAVNKLGAYEDTGLSPEEVEKMLHEYFDLVVEVDRLRKELEGTDELM